MTSSVPCWLTADARAIPVTEMTTRHIVNCLGMLHRKLKEHVAHTRAAETCLSFLHSDDALYYAEHDAERIYEAEVEYRSAVEYWTPIFTSELERRKRMSDSPASCFDAPIVGMSFAGATGVTKVLANGAGLRLRREPHNPYDANAIEVFLEGVPPDNELALPEGTVFPKKLGHISAKTGHAKDLAERMDAQMMSAVIAEFVRGDTGTLIARVPLPLRPFTSPTALSVASENGGTTSTEKRD